MCNHKFEIFFFCTFNNFICIITACCKRLFAQYIYAFVEKLVCDFAMNRCGHTNTREINSFIIEQLIKIVIKTKTVFFRSPFAAFFIGVAKNNV